MLIKPQNNETNYIHFVYRNLTGLGIVLHTVYAVMMGMLQFAIPCFYNICSVLFYIGMLLLVTKRKKYAAAVSLIHLETNLLCKHAYDTVRMEFCFFPVPCRNGFACIFLSLPQNLHSLRILPTAYSGFFPSASQCTGSHIARQMGLFY